MLNTIKHNLRLSSIESRGLDEDLDPSWINLLSKFPKMQNLLNLVNSSANKTNMYKMKLKLANMEISDLK